MFYTILYAYFCWFLESDKWTKFIFDQIILNVDIILNHLTVSMYFIFWREWCIWFKLLLWIIKVDFLNVDTGAGVYLDVRSDYNTPLTSVSGDLDLQPVVSLNNFLIIWFSSQWRNPGVGVTLKVSVQGTSKIQTHIC